MSETNVLAEILGWLRGLRIGIRVDSLNIFAMFDSDGKMHAMSTPESSNGSCDEARYPCVIEEIRLKDASAHRVCEACCDNLVDETNLLKYANMLMALDRLAGVELPDDPKALAELHFQLGSALGRSWVRGLLETRPEIDKMINLVNGRAAQTKLRALVKLRSPELRAKMVDEARSQGIPEWAGCGSDWPETSEVVVGISAFQYGEEIDPYVLAFEVSGRHSAHTVMLAPYAVFKLLDAKIESFAYCLVASGEDGWALAETVSHLWEPGDRRTPFSSFTTAVEAARNCICMPVARRGEELS